MAGFDRTGGPADRDSSQNSRRRKLRREKSTLELRGIVLSIRKLPWESTGKIAAFEIFSTNRKSAELEGEI